MTKYEATRILEVPPNPNQREVDAAFTSLRGKYVATSQYSTHPGERDMASTALVKIQDAYHELTGAREPRQGKPNRAAVPVPSSSIPRASLGGARSPVRQRRANRSQAKNSPKGKRTTTMETAAAFVICAAMFLVSLLILAKVWGCTPCVYGGVNAGHVSRGTFLPSVDSPLVDGHLNHEGDQS